LAVIDFHSLLFDSLSYHGIKGGWHK